MSEQAQQANRRTTRRLALVVVAMFAFAVVILPPLYDLVCDITGLNGKTGRVEQEQVLTSQVDTERLITVEFVANLNAGMPWKFRPMVKKMQVHPGELGQASFYAENLANRRIVGQAIPSVAPNQASKYFDKTECFCFTQQAFEAGQAMEMPVRFVINPKLPAHIKTVTLSYTFFDTASKPPAAAASHADEHPQGHGEGHTG
jgi:cytochrome c oxidase assembly protein subunit 11